MTSRRLSSFVRTAAARAEGLSGGGRLLAAALLAVAAAGLAGWHLRQEESRLRSRLAPVEIVVAARALAAGVPLGAGDLAIAALPREALPGGGLAPGAIDALVGRRLLVPLRAGDPVLGSLIGDPDGLVSLAAGLPEGRRAVAVPIDAVSAAGGHIEAADRVDALLVWQEAGGESRAVTLLEGIRVLAVGEATRPGARSPEAATAVLEVTPGDAEALVLALDRGRLALALRSPGDAARRPDRRATTLGPLVPGYRAPVERPRPVEVIRGPR